MVESHEINWQRVKELDEKYYMHACKSEKEYTHIPIARTEGNYLYKPDGTKLLDFCSQLSCVNLGQRHPKIIEKIKEALDRYGFLWDGFCTDYRSRVVELIMETLLGKEAWPGRLRFVNSGSEANELALIVARLYTNRPNIVSREHSYHGWTQGAVGCTRFRAFRAGLVSDHDAEIRDIPNSPPGGYYVVPAPYCYRCSIGHDYPDCKGKDGRLACVRATESLMRTIGPETIAAFIGDVAYGSPAIDPPPEYVPQIRQLTRQLGILWIDDEVICGFGRLGRWFGYQLYEDSAPDIMTIAKGLSSSAVPTGGIVVSQEIARFFGEYRWWAISTFGGHPLAMAAVVGNLEAMIEMDLPAMVERSGQYLGHALNELASKHPCVGNVSGTGLLWGVDLVKDRATREPFVPEDRHTLLAGKEVKKFPSNLIKEKCAEKGVLMGGLAPNALRIYPGLTITKEEMDQGIEALDYAFSELDKLCE